MRLFTSFEALIKPNQSSWENQLTIPTSTLENLHSQRQSGSKKKCLILKNVWAVIFWDLERIDANDSNTLGVMRKCVYIEKGGKCKISVKNNKVNRFTYCMNRFRQLNDKLDEQWSLFRIKHKLNRFKSPQMKIDTIQTLMNRFNQSQSVSWYESLKFESIQARNKWKIDADNIWIDSEKQWIDSLRYYSWKLWIDWTHFLLNTSYLILPLNLSNIFFTLFLWQISVCVFLTTISLCLFSNFQVIFFFVYES